MREPVVDVAELSEPPRRSVPRWLRSLGIGLVVVAVGWLVFLRATDTGIGVRHESPRFTDNYTVELDVRVTNAGDDPLEMDLSPPKLDGLDYRGVRWTAQMAAAPSGALPLAARGHTSISLTWRVDDCARALAGTDKDAVLSLEVGSGIGSKELVSASLGRWADLIPPICRTRPDVGVPRLAGQEINPQWDSVFVKVTVMNTGGRPITFRAGDLPVGWSHMDSYTAVPTTQRRIPVGDQRIVLLRFEANDCGAPVQGSAQVTLRFDIAGTTRTASLPIQLADSWENLLGVCTSSGRDTASTQ